MISGLSRSAAACSAPTSATARKALSCLRKPIPARFSSCSMKLVAVHHASSGVAFPSASYSSAAANSASWRLSADKIATIFGKRVSRRMHGKLATVIDQIEHGHHVFRAYFKSGFLKQYEKFLTFLRNELVSNNLTDFGLRKGLDHLDAVRTTFQVITDRFAGFQAEWLNVHVDFPLLQRLAHPITIGAVRYPGLKITSRASSACSRSSCMAVLRSAAGRPGRCIKPSSTPSTSLKDLPPEPAPLRLAQAQGTRPDHATARATPPASPKGSKSPSSSSSSTRACAAPSPTAASITGRTRNTVQTAGSKPPITAPTPPSNASSISWLQLDRAAPH